MVQIILITLLAANRGPNFKSLKNFFLTKRFQETVQNQAALFPVGLEDAGSVLLLCHRWPPFVGSHYDQKCITANMKEKWI